jgi:alpha-galactosidase
MPKITIIGAGGYVFPLRLIGDLLSFPALQNSTITLMDIDQHRAEQTAAAARQIVEHYGFPTILEVTTDRRRALTDAQVVFVTFQVGGLAAYHHDVAIPRRYGLDQPVGDTLGPGGVMRFLRSAPVYQAIAADMHELCPDALLINYANPMAMNCWLLDRLGVQTIGLCHSVQNTSQLLARRLNLPYAEVRYLVAGINHQAWFLQLRHGAVDLYPQLRQTMTARYLSSTTATSYTSDQGDHSSEVHADSDYEGAQERVRSEIMAAFGYFHTESSHHASEYLPYFRKHPELVQSYLPQRWDYYQICANHDEPGQRQAMIDRLTTKLEPSLEYGAQIVHALITNERCGVYGNVANRGLISNLPAGCCVEVPCLVDGNGVQPTAIGELPAQCAALNRSNINVQHLAVEAVLSESREHIYHAIMLDPLTGALLTLPQIRAMVDELLLAEAAWLPAFAQIKGTV